MEDEVMGSGQEELVITLISDKKSDNIRKFIKCKLNKFYSYFNYFSEII
jgi:hypothetical protein